MNMTALNTLHPQYITNTSGEKVSVVLSVEEFEALVEDLEDLAVIAERRDEPSTSHEDLLKELKEDGLL